MERCMTDDIFLGSYEMWVITCPKHGEHKHVIHSSIKGYEGQWCQLCWIEMLGDPLPAVLKNVPYEDNNE